MPQGQIQRQTQEQKLEQKQSVKLQQLLHAQLVELPLNQFVDRINTEMADNPALEIESPGESMDSLAEGFSDSGGDTYDDNDFDSVNEREERRSALDEALASIGRDDEDLPVYHGGSGGGEEREEMVYGQDTSFYDSLREQMGETVMTEKQRQVMEYIIGSLDDDGLLRKTADAIDDELAVFHNIATTPAEIEGVIRLLQTFEPAGIGARNLQECLLLQIERRDNSPMKTLMERVVKNHFDKFMKKRWDKIAVSMKLSEQDAEALSAEMRKLNPKPGAALGETMGHSIQQITPDFIVDTDDEGKVTFTMNNSEVPELQVSQSFADMMEEYRNNREGMNRQMKEALLYTRNKVAAAQNFIEAVKMRRHTLTTTMRAIIQWQRRFFQDGDEQSIRPMRLVDISEKTGLDISTISRVSNSKYAQTRWGTFPLRHFFSDAYTTDTGEEMSTRTIKVALRDIIDGEDKKSPYSDDRLSALLAEKGYPIARRTVTKYREQMGIPTARLRK